MEESKQDIWGVADRIRRRLDELGMTPRAASLKTGRGTEVIRNIYRAARAGKPYSPQHGTAELVAKVLGVRVAYLMSGELPMLDDAKGLRATSEDFDPPGTSKRNVSGFQQDAARYVHDEKSNISKNIIDATLKDRANAYPWIMKSDVLAMAGIRPGDVLIVESGIDARDGDIVRAQVENEGGGADTVVRLFKAPNIIGAGLDPTSTPIETVDGERVRVVGVMTELIRFRP
jgi:SOS-response transcriptional repressor LexA